MVARNDCTLAYTQGVTPSLTSSCTIGQPAGRRLQDEDEDAQAKVSAKIAAIEERLTKVEEENSQLKAELKAMHE